MLDSTLMSPAAAIVNDLRRQLVGQVIFPNDPEYDDARSGFNLLFNQYPALIVMAACADDVGHAVRYAVEQGLDIAVQATGHGVASLADGAVIPEQ